MSEYGSVALRDVEAVCPKCGKSGLIETTGTTLVGLTPMKVEGRYCRFCGLDEQRYTKLETEAQRLMREHLEQYHGVESEKVPQVADTTLP